MSLKAAIPWILGLLAFALLGFLVFEWLLPARTTLNEAVVSAEGQVAQARLDSEDLVGSAYKDSVQQGKAVAKAVESRLIATLKGHDEQLTSPVDQATGGSIPEKCKRYTSAYRWAQDELRRKLLAESEKRGIKGLPEVPLRTPPFLGEGRDPVDLAEIAAADRSFNVERILLTAAARAGAFPVAPAEIRGGWKAAPSDARFSDTRATLHLDVAPAEVPALVRSLCALEGNGPVVRIEKLHTEPKTLSMRKDEGVRASVLAQVGVVLAVYRGDS